MAALEAVLLLTQAEGPLTTFHDRSNLLTHGRDVYCALFLDVPGRLVSGSQVSTYEHQFGISVYDQVCIMAREHQLASILRSPDLGDDLLHGVAIEIILGLIDNQRCTALRK